MGDYVINEQLLTGLEEMLSSLTDTDEKVAVLNQLKILLHRHSPFKDQPVDCVLWVQEKNVIANDYNPNSVAPAEKRLLWHSLEKDGFTQPIVVSETQGQYLIIDGFHRHELGKRKLGKKLHGYLPVSRINYASQGTAEHIAITIRHNRARGKHLVAAMSDIVRDLTRLGWSDMRIGTELGMDADEVLRLKQISGLADLFSGWNFNDSWTVS